MLYMMTQTRTDRLALCLATPCYRLSLPRSARAHSSAHSAHSSARGGRCVSPHLTARPLSPVARWPLQLPPLLRKLLLPPAAVAAVVTAWSQHGAQLHGARRQAQRDLADDLAGGRQGGWRVGARGGAAGQPATGGAWARGRPPRGALPPRPSSHCTHSAVEQRLGGARPSSRPNNTLRSPRLCCQPSPAGSAAPGRRPAPPPG